jgi:hypothetical protein
MASSEGNPALTANGTVAAVRRKLRRDAPPQVFALKEPKSSISLQSSSILKTVT